MPKEVVPIATELGSAFISVGLGTNKLGAEIKQAFGGAGDIGEQAGKQAGSRFGGAIGLAAAAVGALGIGAFFKDAIGGAANLEQSVGAIDSVFKGSAAEMHSWAQSAATDVGLSANEFNELGTLIGSQLKNGGTAMDELAPKTKSLISTGADLASMFGGTTSEAVEALSSALKGERDPIERYGVSLNQAKIDAEAAALGFEKVGGSLSAEANQAATLSLIMKQTADAHGNFASEADTLAHKQQVLNAQWANGKARIGTELLPAVAGLTGALSSALGPAIDGSVAAIKTLVGGTQGLYDLLVKGDFTTAFREAFRVEEDSPLVDFLFRIREALQQVRPMFASLSATWGPMVPQLAALVSSFSPLSLIFQAIQPVLPNIAGLFQVLALIIGTVLTAALTQLAPLMSTLVGIVSGVLVSVMPAINAMFIVFSEALVSLVPVLVGVLGALLPLVGTLLTQLAPIVTSLITSILPPLVSIFGNIVNAIGPLITIIAAALIPIITALLPIVVNVFDTVAKVITQVMKAVQGVIQVVTGAIKGDWDQVWTGVQNIFSGIWGAISALVSGAMKHVGMVISNGLNLALSVVTGILGSIGSFFINAFNGMASNTSGFIGNLVGMFASLPGRIMGALGGLAGMLVGVGRDMIQGLINGVGGMINNAVQAVRNVGGAMLDGIKGFLGIKSPSRVFKSQVGMMIGAGVIAGVDASKRGVDSSIRGLVSVPSVPSFRASSYAPAGAYGAGSGATNNITINQVDDPIGTANAVSRRFAALGT